MMMMTMMMMKMMVMMTKTCTVRIIRCPCRNIMLIALSNEKEGRQTEAERDSAPYVWSWFANFTVELNGVWICLIGFHVADLVRLRVSSFGPDVRTRTF